MRKTSIIGRTFIDKWEWVPRSRRCGWDPVRQLYFPYKDYRGFPTFGRGHLIRPHEDFSAGCTEDRVEQIFEADLLPVERAVDEHVTVPLSQHQFDALIDFGFNEGIGRLDPSRNTAIRMLNQGHYDMVPKLLEAWCISDGQHDEGLLNRRMGEGKMFMTPDDPGDDVSDEARLAYANAFGIFALLPDRTTLQDDEEAPPTPRNDV